MEYENPEILRIRDITRKLERVNQEVDRLLVRLPLDHHNEVARLNMLISEQVRLTGILPRVALPSRITVFYQNAQDRASFLQKSYNEAIHRGKLRRPKTAGTFPT